MSRSFFWEWEISNGLDVPIGKRLRFLPIHKIFCPLPLLRLSGSPIRFFLEPKTFCRIEELRALKE